MDFGDLGRMLVLVGILIVAIGMLLVFFPRVPFIGKLPGDISFQSGGFSCFFPLATSIILSIVLTIILNLVLRLLNR